MRFLFLLAAAAMAAKVTLPLSGTDWALIHTSNANYLQLEVLGLAGEPILDSSRIEPSFSKYGVAHANLRVFWKFIAIPEAQGSLVRRAQLLWQVDAGSSTFDTVFSCGPGGCEPVAGLKRVENVPGPVICIAKACAQLDSTAARALFDATVATSGWIGVLDPRLTSMASKPDWWSLATGSEKWSEVVAPLASNAGNWVNIDRVKMGLARLIKDDGVSVGGLEFPTGMVKYVYNQIDRPVDLGVGSTSVRIFHDTLLKVGVPLALSGSTQRICERLPIDTLMTKNAWLVAATSGSEIGPSMVYNSLCGRRDRAWKVVGDSVWLNSKAKVLLTELFPPVSVARPQETAAGARLVGVSGRQWLELRQTSEVVCMATNGQILLRSRWEAGRHELPVGVNRGLLLVQVKSLVTGKTAVFVAMRGPS